MISKTMMIKHAMIDINSKMYQSECAKYIRKAIQRKYKETDNLIYIYETVNGGYHIILVDETETKILIDNLENDLKFYQKFELIYKIKVRDFNDAVKQFSNMKEETIGA